MDGAFVLYLQLRALFHHFHAHYQFEQSEASPTGLHLIKLLVLFILVIANVFFLKFLGVTILEEDSGPDGVTMDIEMQWDGNPNIVLDIKTRVGVVLPVQVIHKPLPTYHIFAC